MARRGKMNLHLRRGAFTRAAARQGMSVGEAARRDYDAPGRLGREARFAALVRSGRFGHHRGRRGRRR